MNSREVELAWAAGFFDGEGYVSSRLAKNQKAWFRRIEIQINQCDPEVLERFRKAVGCGSIRGPYGPYGKNPGNKRPVYYLMITGYANGLAVADALDRYLSSIKRKQLHEALRHYEDLGSHGRENHLA